MLQERLNGDAGGGHLRGEPQYRQPLLRPPAQGNPQREHPRGAAGKTSVFGLLKRGEKVFVTVVSDCSRESLMPVIKGLILEQSTIYTDGWRAYDGLVLNGYEHYRVSLEASLRIPQRERFRARQEPCQRDREFLELRQEAAREAQRLQLRRIRATH